MIVAANLPGHGADLKLRYDRPATFFEEGLVIGNGRIGATVYGGVNRDRLSLNDITLWTGGPDTVASPAGLPEQVKVVRDLLDKGDYRGAEKANMKLEGHYSENYQPLGNLLIDNLNKSAATDYYRHLDLEDATVVTRFAQGGGGLQKEYFCSSPDSVIVVRLTSTGSLPLNFEASFTSLLPHEVKAHGKGELLVDGYAAHHSYPVYYNAVPDSLKHEYDPAQGVHFATAIKVLAPNSLVTVADGKIRVRGGREALLIVANATSFNGFNRHPVREGRNYRADVERIVNRAAARTYAELRNRHVADYQNLFGRVSLNLGTTDPEIKKLTTDRQLRLYTDSLQSNPELEALYFQFGRYLLIASSRTPGVPANLQGLWNERLLPPWSSNYTTNINMEENYWGAETTNLGELHYSLLGFLKNLSVNGSRTAREFYGVNRGWCLGHNSDIWAMTAPVGLQSGSPSWACWNMGGTWAATHIWEHYLFTHDKEFLRQYYPTLKGAAEFCLDWMVERDGKLITSPSTSPENMFVTDSGHWIATSAGATCDLAMIRQCLADAADAAEALGTDAAFVAEARKALSRMAPYQVGKNGGLQEWLIDFKESEPSHRHQSHLFGVYPGRHLTPSATPEFAKAAHRTLELRGTETTGWSTGWRVNLYARLLDADNAYATYRRLLRYVSPDGYRGADAKRGGGTYPNLLDAHSPFQIDGNFGGSAGVAEMLIQSTPTSITLLPALPAQWAAEGSVKGLCARGGFVVDMTWKDGRITSATVTSPRGGKTTVSYNGRTARVNLKPGASTTLK